MPRQNYRSNISFKNSPLEAFDSNEEKSSRIKSDPHVAKSGLLLNKDLISKIKDIRFINEHPELDETTKSYIQSEYPDILNSNFPFCYTKLKRYKCTLDYYITKIINDSNRIVNISTFSDLDKNLDNRCGNWKLNPEEYLRTLSSNLQNDYAFVKSSVRFLFNDTYQYNSNKIDGTPIKLHVIFNIFV